MSLDAAITFAGDRLRVDFRRFDPDAYRLFLRCKALPESQVVVTDPDTLHYAIEAPARYAGLLGVQQPTPITGDLPVKIGLYDDQVAIVRLALAAKRFACWSDCGLGKTLVGLEWARHVLHRTHGRVLIVTMNEIVGQWIEEARHWYGCNLPMLRLASRQDMRDWCRAGPGHLAITNYEKWNPESLDRQLVSEAKHLAGVILDESSRLKTGGGKQKWALIKSCKGIEYKLSLTATPAPNDLMEFASQASFLETMRSEHDIIWTFFRRDDKSHRWTVKPHARAAFFEFMSGWSIYLRDPRRYGWRRDVPDVPEPEILIHTLEPTQEQVPHLLLGEADRTGQLTLLPEPGRRNFIQAGRLSQVAKGFRYRKGRVGDFERIASSKPGFVADLVDTEVRDGRQVLVWTVFDAESTLITEALQARGVAYDLLTGATREAQRLEILDRFRAGVSRVLVSRPAMLGWGLNFQCCSSMVFSGFTFSYEQFYQALRRAYRHGQTRRLRVHIPIVRGLEEDMLEAIERKQEQHEVAIREMEDNYVRARQALGGVA